MDDSRVEIPQHIYHEFAQSCGSERSIDLLEMVVDYITENYDVFEKGKVQVIIDKARRVAAACLMEVDKRQDLIEKMKLTIERQDALINNYHKSFEDINALFNQ